MLTYKNTKHVQKVSTVAIITISYTRAKNGNLAFLDLSLSYAFMKSLVKRLNFHLKKNLTISTMKQIQIIEL